VTNSKIASGAVTGTKMNLNGVTAPSADTAATATTATNANNLGGQPASAYALATPLQETPATLENGWTNGSGFGNVSYAKDQFGIVRLFGAATSAEANDGAIFTLPPGDRPPYTIDVPAAFSFTADGVLPINTDGTVVPESSSTFFVDLEGITFAGP
jgi:hypothetical protein